MNAEQIQMRRADGSARFVIAGRQVGGADGTGEHSEFYWRKVRPCNLFFSSFTGGEEG